MSTYDFLWRNIKRRAVGTGTELEVVETVMRDILEPAVQDTMPAMSWWESFTAGFLLTFLRTLKERNFKF